MNVETAHPFTSLEQCVHGVCWMRDQRHPSQDPLLETHYLTRHIERKWCCYRPSSLQWTAFPLWTSLTFLANPLLPTQVDRPPVHSSGHIAAGPACTSAMLGCAPSPLPPSLVHSWILLTHLSSKRRCYAFPGTGCVLQTLCGFSLNPRQTLRKGLFIIFSFYMRNQGGSWPDGSPQSSWFAHYRSSSLDTDLDVLKSEQSQASCPSFPGTWKFPGA